MFTGCKWHETPPVCKIDGDTLTVVTSDKTDVWRITQYDFIHDNGHFFGKSVDHAFTAQLRVRANFQELYVRIRIWWVRCAVPRRVLD